jgi:AcrR family transcriptional regulator
MASNKSTETQARTALAPTRRPGQERVAALLEAAAIVIAEKGYDAATMAEVASRAGAQIGSLYRFFPNKDVLVNALVERFRVRTGETFDAIDKATENRPVTEFADALVDALGDLRADTRAIVALLEGTAELSSRRLEFRRNIRKRIAQSLIRRCPELRKAQAEDVAAVLLQVMKSARALMQETDNGVRPSALNELRVMARRYLETTFADAGGQR